MIRQILLTDRIATLIGHTFPDKDRQELPEEMVEQVGGLMVLHRMGHLLKPNRSIDK